MEWIRQTLIAVKALWDGVVKFRPTPDQIRLLEALWGRASTVSGAGASSDTARIAWEFLRAQAPGNVPSPLMLGYLTRVAVPNLVRAGVNPAVVPRTAILLRALLGRTLAGIGLKSLALPAEALFAKLVATAGLSGVALLAAALLAVAVGVGIKLASRGPDSSTFVESTGHPPSAATGSVDVRGDPLGALKDVSGLNPAFVTAMKRCDEARQAMIRWRHEYSAATERDLAACAARNVPPADCPQSSEARAAALAARAADDAAMTCNKDAHGAYVPAFAGDHAAGPQIDDAELQRSLLEYGESQRKRFEASVVSWQRLNHIDTTAVSVTSLKIQPYPDTATGIYRDGDTRYPYTAALRFDLLETQNGLTQPGFRVISFLYDSSRSSWTPQGDLNADCVGYFLGEAQCR